MRNITQDSKGIFTVITSEYIDGYESVMSEYSYLIAKESEYSFQLFQRISGVWTKSFITFHPYDCHLGTVELNVPGVLVEITDDREFGVSMPTDVLLFMAKCLVASKYPGIDSNAGSIGSMGRGYSAYVGGMGEMVEG